MLRSAGILLFVMITATQAMAGRPQILPEPMLVNLFALTEASATLQICADSTAYPPLPDEKKALLRRLQGRIDKLVQRISRKYDDDLFGFFVERRNQIAGRPDLIETTRSRYSYCGDDLFKRMKRYIYDSRQKLDYFLSQQPNVK